VRWAVVMLLVGCDAEPVPFADPAVVEFSPTPETAAAVQEAIAEWNACGAARHGSIGGGTDAVTVDIVDPSAPILEGHVGVTPFRCEFECQASAIHVAKGAGPQVIRHELGHALMPWRSALPLHFGHGLMQAKIKPDARVTEEDCAALRKWPNP